MVSTISNNVDTSNFKFVQVNGQYRLGIAVRTESGNKYINFFSKEEDLISYVDVSYTGFDLPAVEIIFSFSDKNLVPYLCEKAIFVVSIGADMDSQIQSTFNIVTADVQQKVKGKWNARIVGIYDRLQYIKNPKKQVYGQYSCEVAKQILQESLGKPVKCKVDVRSKDHMFWLQSNMSNYRFLYELWQHQYIPDSIWLTAIDFEGQPIMTDLRKQAKSQPKVMLTTGNTTTDNTYSILDAFDVRSNSGITNNFGGYAKTKPIHNMDEARTTTAQKKEKVLLAETDSFNRAYNVETEAPYALQTSNVHMYYQSAPLTNKSMYLSLKAFQLDVTVEGKFVPVELLDYVMLKDIQPNGQAQEDYSGLYMVGKIAHQIANKKIYTHITVWRESQNVLAAPTPAVKAEATETKIDNMQKEIDSGTELMTKEEYVKKLKQYADLNQQIEDFKSKMKDKISDTTVYKKYKDMEKKYREMRNYLTDVYTTSSLLSELFPFMDVVTEKLADITAETPLEDVQSAIRKYVDVQKYVSLLDSKVTDKINSNAVYTNYISAKGEYNRMTSTIRELQSTGIIGDINEYLESEGEEQ